MKNVTSGQQLEELETTLREHGVKITRQRRAILASLAESGDHPNAEELRDRAREYDPSVSLATVYRTMTTLEEYGTVIRNEFEKTGARYELSNKPHHDHLIDIDTGDVIEFVSEEIEALQERLVEEMGYEIVSHRLEIQVRKKQN